MAAAITPTLVLVDSQGRPTSPFFRLLAALLEHVHTFASLTGTPTTISGYGITDHLTGTATNDNAAAGKIGEYISSTVLVGAAVSLTTDTTSNITSISLTAGDWDVNGTVSTSPNAATTTAYARSAISLVSATLPTSPGSGGINTAGAIVAGNNVDLPTGTVRISLAATTTVFLVTRVGFAVNVMSAYGFLGARRAR